MCTCNYANAKANQLETGAGVTIKALGEHLLHPLGSCILDITRFVDCHNAVHVQRSRAPSAAARSITNIRYVFNGVWSANLLCRFYKSEKFRGLCKTCSYLVLHVIHVIYQIHVYHTIPCMSMMSPNNFQHTCT